MKVLAIGILCHIETLPFRDFVREYPWDPLRSLNVTHIFRSCHSRDLAYEDRIKRNNKQFSSETITISK